MNEDQQARKDQVLRGEKDWQKLSPAQCRSVSLGIATMATALALGCYQPLFNGLSVLALLLAAFGLVIILRALRKR